MGKAGIVQPYEIWRDGIAKPNPKLAGEYRELLNEIAENDPDNLWPSKARECPQNRREFLIPVTPRFLDVRARGRTPDGLGRFLLLECRNPEGEIVRQWLPSEAAASRAILPKQAAKGFPIHTENAADIVKFISWREGQDLPSIIVSPQFGRIRLPDGSVGFLIGREWIGPKGISVVPDPALELNKVFKGTWSAGTLAEWRGIWKFAFQTQTAPIRFLFGSAFAPCIIQTIGVRSFTVHHWSRTGGGKSALQAFRASIWGCPKGVYGPSNILTFGSTEKNILEQVVGINGIPVMVNELQASDAKADVRAALNFVYRYAEEQARGRLNPDGSIQERRVSTWRSTLNTNGEKPILGSEVGQGGGARNRILQINANAMTEESAANLHQWMDHNECFGVMGPAFLRWLVPHLNDEDGKQALKRYYRQILAEITPRAAIKGQRLHYLGSVALASALAFTVLWDGERAPLSACEQYFPQVIQDAIEVSGTLESEAGRTGENETEQIIRDIQTHYTTHPLQWIDTKNEDDVRRLDRGEYQNLTGVLNPKESRCAAVRAWVTRPAIQYFLRQRNMESIDSFLGDLRDLGYCYADKTGKALHRRSIRGVKFEAVALTHWP